MSWILMSYWSRIQKQYRATANSECVKLDSEDDKAGCDRHYFPTWIQWGGYVPQQQ